ncbi:MAG: hypothetical protein SFY95_08940 [Planctomycetota bacterium]|nr:hypothetical protein [Planctomycetota bacterium]
MRVDAIRRWASCLALVMMAWLAPGALAQVTIDWQTVDGGGVVSMTGGAIELTGSVGQPDASVLSAGVQNSPGEIILAGGFWALDTAPFCVADVDRSGFVDSDDYVAFVQAFTDGCFGSGNPNLGCLVSADFDRSGFIDSDDFVAFVEAFLEGC